LATDKTQMMKIEKHEQEETERTEGTLTTEAQRHGGNKTEDRKPRREFRE